jgi:hypothetical protein
MVRVITTCVDSLSRETCLVLRIIGKPDNMFRKRAPGSVTAAVLYTMDDRRLSLVRDDGGR